MNEYYNGNGLASKLAIILQTKQTRENWREEEEKVNKKRDREGKSKEETAKQSEKVKNNC